MIYQNLWDIDQENNGCKVATRLANGSWSIADADIKLDQQVKSSGRRNIDLATRPLFNEVKSSVFDKPTYSSFIKLLDNYIVDYRVEETEIVGERQEISDFLNTIIPTKVMQRAFEYINGSLGMSLTKERFREELERMWFEPYTNYFNGVSTHFCSGFEHVFVGEGAYSIRFGAAETLGEIKGYHNWVKFYFDEENNRVNYLGYKYDLRGDETPNNPNVITLQMQWFHKDLTGNITAELFKKKGGFFVGTSPECEIAMGTVAYYEHLAGMLVRDLRRTTINGANYDLVMYRETKNGGGNGNHIRSFFPMFLGDIADTQPISDRPRVQPVPPGTLPETNNGKVIVVEALVNPVGPEDDGEWVKIQNKSGEDIDLTDWKLADRMGRRQSLSGTLAADQSLQIIIDRNKPDAMLLSNDGGAIVLYYKEEVVASVKYKRAKSGEILKFI